RAMQPPPLGTVSRSRVLKRPEITDGIVNGVYASRIPLSITRALLGRGRSSFDVYCAACHGLDGSGDSVVARHMEQRRPPGLTPAPVLTFPPGRIYQVIAEGYGLMPAYDRQLTIEERWGVVAYVRALQLSRAARLEALPDEDRRAVEESRP